MSEGMSSRERISRDMGKQDIQTGMADYEAEYLDAPASKEGTHPDLTESFDIEKAPEPMRREDLERAVEEFVKNHLEKIIPILVSSTESSPGVDEMNDLIQRLGITNEQVGLLGANYYIRQDGGGAKVIYKTDEYNPDGYPVSNSEVGTTDLLALTWAKHSVRMDTSRASNYSHRYYLKPEGRYLCANDFGMKQFDEEEKRMTGGDVTNAAPLIETVKRELVRIQENLQTIINADFSELLPGRLEEARLQVGAEYLGHDQQYAVQQTVWQEVMAATIKRLTENERNRDLLLSAVPANKVARQLHFKYEKIAQKLGLSGTDPVADYAGYTRSGNRKINQLFRPASETEKAGTSFSFYHSELHSKPIIAGPDYVARLTEQAKTGVRDVLAQRAADADPVVREIFQRYICKRGEQSPYFYANSKIYDLIQSLGVEKAAQVLDNDDRSRSEQLQGLEYLEAMGYNLAEIEPDRLKKQLKEAYKLSRSNVWNYLQEREQEDQTDGASTNKPNGKDWLAQAGKRKGQKLFAEGKRMYWLAQQVYMKSPGRNETDRFYHADQRTDWSRYDLTAADVPNERVSEYLDKHKSLIIALMGQEESNGYGNGQQEKAPGKQATLGLIIQALEKGNDIRGAALAYDKQRYLGGVIEETVPDDLSFALEDWPAELRSAVSKDEIDLYYEYSHDYIQLDPNGLVKYATWRATAEGQEWNELFAEAPKQKSDLDFRICVAGQTQEVRGWYKDAAEYAGGQVVQNYLLRFNATRDGNGRLANWHDILFWVPNIRKLERADAKAILSNIQTIDENQELVQFVPRYSKERDPFKESGPIQSLRELKKRVFAIESNIDLSQFPPEVVDITDAPGFNLAALESMKRRADFPDLFEGKLDKEQPFKPHVRMFAGRPLSDALREGLGSHKLQVRGTATDVKGLFHKLKLLIKGRMNGEKAMDVPDLLNNVPVDLEQEVITLLQEQRVDIGPTVEAQVHAKSDPEGWVCGNYTDCCMPFGADNNTDYMFNPSTQYFSVKYNGRIIAQSVVVDSRDRRDRSDVVVLDNIEVANNYKHLTPLLAKVYQTFWTEYTSKAVKIGTGYSDLTPPNAKLEENNYEPKISLVYSDARGGQIYDLPKMRGIESLDQIVTFANLTERDADLIAKMEAEAYPGDMAQGKAHIMDTIRKQRELEVPGAASSFVMRQGDEPAGYLLMLPEESEIAPGQQVAHVYDMAVLPKFQGTGLARKMIDRVLEVATAYNVSIEAEARASTSYALLMSERMRAWFESKGFHLAHNEKMPKYLGDEDFYHVRFENRQGRNTEE